MKILATRPPPASLVLIKEHCNMPWALMCGEGVGGGAGGGEWVATTFCFKNAQQARAKKSKIKHFTGICRH